MSLSQCPDVYGNILIAKIIAILKEELYLCSPKKVVRKKLLA